ncbi:hypothetical protein GCM10011515_18820 [Tsuneonella deserti]|uniref:TonB-dependent receptor plug domain-containing protein n=1 Tax=Tsuneonella deserti TaxID=2035528 RepID=A0ABQ1SCD9_9SPHN|nr:TonB-dependent receptor plug domain-containing protein [Tsuneonella deserti]GGD99197.1 hypothetical protein GCM10011515_18820 [Tsuneonella deserti]
MPKTGRFLIAVSALALAWPALANDGGSDAATDAANVASAPDDGRQVYAPDYFARFAPKSALDMLSQVPGFSIREDDQGRGLGQANTNVLINGERVALKSEGIGDRLRRISADKVTRIEIVDGASLNIPGLSGQVANVITSGGGVSGQFDWKTRFRPGYVEPEWFGGNVSVSGSAKTLEYSLALSNDNGRGAAKGPTVITDGQGTLIETRQAHIANVSDSPKIAASLKWDGPGSSVANFNASYQRQWYHGRFDEERFPVSGVPRHRDYEQHDKDWNYEIGGDFEFALGPGRLKLIGLERYDHDNYYEDVVFTKADGSPPFGGRYVNMNESGEHIGRGEYSWKMLGGDWQLAGEAAFNRYSGVATLYDLTPDGDFVELPFSAGTGGVTEDRYEVVLTHGRQLAKNLSLQVGLGGEYSKLSQTGANGLTRSFYRPKGSVSLAWTPSKGLDLSLKVARVVGQLSFGDFLARVDLDQGQNNAGNVELVPPQRWNVDFEVKKDLGRWGTTDLKLFYSAIDDYIDVIPLGGGAESTGNIPHAHRFGLDWTSTVNLDPIGLKGAKIDTNLVLEKSQVKDPVTGLARYFSNYQDRHAEANFRYDIPDSSWAGGFGVQYNHRRPYWRLYEVGLNYEGPIYSTVFVENKDVFGLTVRAEYFNVTNGHRFVERTVYDGPRDTSPVLFIESTRQKVGPIFNLSVSGKF